MADTYVVERSIAVDAPPQDVYERVSNFRRWSEWSPWDQLDPNMTKTYEGKDATVGSSYSWQGNRKAGSGKMTISDLDAPSRVTIDLRFLKPFKSQSTTQFALAPEAGRTHVTWTMTGKHTWMSKIMGIFVSMDKLVGKDFVKGLEKLKSTSEA